MGTEITILVSLRNKYSYGLRGIPTLSPTAVIYEYVGAWMKSEHLFEVGKGKEATEGSLRLEEKAP